MPTTRAMEAQFQTLLEKLTASMNANMGEMKSELTGMNANMGEMKSDLTASMNANMTEMKSELTASMNANMGVEYQAYETKRADQRQQGRVEK
ncbi:hypothetical protein TNCV_1898391 [Trichonephila clavipes]|uniref:Uncharacterized protein n=1 Tax=Trichonephila clavipes TaxID=2585209 RepID=A0A8X6WF19_TRICX|nr:hypothetical protein TNCV_1898391 [Trichonephila clavipes]